MTADQTDFARSFASYGDPLLALVTAMERQVRDLQGLANDMSDAKEAAQLDSCIDAMKRQITTAAAHGPSASAMLGFDRGNV